MDGENPVAETAEEQAGSVQEIPEEGPPADEKNIPKPFTGLKDKKKALAAIMIAAAVLCALCLSVKLLQRRNVSLVVDETDISSLERYRAGDRLDLSGSTCYAEIDEFISGHPKIKVRYTVDLGGSSVWSDSKKLDLVPGDYTYAALSENLRYLHDLKHIYMPQTDLSGSEIAALRESYPDLDISFTCDLGGRTVASSERRLMLSPGEYTYEKLIGFVKAADLQKLTLDHTGLSSEQLAAISAELPADGFSYSVMHNGKEYSSSDRKIETHATDREADDLAELLRCLPGAEKIEISAGNEPLSVESIIKLYSANPSAEYSAEFEFFGQRISTEDEEIIYKNADIGNEGVAQVRQVLPMLVNCKRFVLDDCGIDNEVMASLRDDFPDKKIVWRVHWQNRYSALTDVTIIRAGSYVKCSNDGGIQDLKYCTDVVFADLGHNRHLTDISFLSTWKHIRVLLIDDAMMDSIDALSGATELQLIEMVKCFNLTSLEPLANCKNLRFINFSNCYEVPDLSPLYGLDKLERIYCMGLHKNKHTDKNQRNEIREKLPNCSIYFDPPPESEIGGLYSVGWKLDAPWCEYSEWYLEVSKIFRYRTVNLKEGIFNYEEEPDELFYFNEDDLTVFTKERSM